MWMVLAEIPQEISVPIGLPVVESKLTDAMAPTMNEDGVRAVQNLPASVSQPTTEIYVLEPDREEAFIETASVFPRLRDTVFDLSGLVVFLDHRACNRQFIALERIRRALVRALACFQAS